MPVIGWLTCPSCKARYPTARPEKVTGNVLCRCGVLFTRKDNRFLVPPPAPSIVQKGTNYVAAWRKWQVAGRPRRSDEDIDKLREICKACVEYYDDGTCNHPKCGCGVAEAGWLGDKLAWATEHCPICKW